MLKFYAKLQDKETWYNVYYNNHHLGDFVMDVDGYYKFFPELTRGGYWEGWVLRDIADKETELNKDWDQQVEFDNG
jgi:hypothetical protein